MKDRVIRAEAVVKLRDYHKKRAMDFATFSVRRIIHLDAADHLDALLAEAQSEEARDGEDRELETRPASAEGDTNVDPNARPMSFEEQNADTEAPGLREALVAWVKDSGRYDSFETPEAVADEFLHSLASAPCLGKESNHV